MLAAVSIPPPAVRRMSEGDRNMRMENATLAGRSKKTSVTLWIIQGLLAALFLFAGGMKLVMPIAALTQQSSLPGWFLRFIGVAEVLGAVGLVLPGLLRIRPGLTPIAAAGLVVIMTGATLLTMPMGVAAAMFPLFVGVLSVSVAYGRRDALHHAI